jgi:hypothetical protein
MATDYAPFPHTFTNRLYTLKDAQYREITLLGEDGQSWRVKNHDGQSFRVHVEGRDLATYQPTREQLLRAVCHGIRREVSHVFDKGEPLEPNDHPVLIGGIALEAAGAERPE